MSQDQEQNTLERMLRTELSYIENRLLARRGQRDSRWLTIGTVSILVLLSLVALIGALLTQPGIFDLMQAWLAEAPLPGGVSETGVVEISRVTTQNAASNPYAFTQFMTLFLAISAGGIAYLASAMGMKRLERYDEQFQAFREESQKSDDRNEKRFESSRASLKEEIQDKNTAYQKDVLDDLNKRLDSVTSDNREAVEATIKVELHKLNEIREKFDEDQARFSKMLDRFTMDPRSVLLNEPSIGEVHRKVTLYFSQDEAEKGRELTRAVINARDATTGRLTTTGDLDDWFNLSAQLGRNDEFLLGLQVTLAGLAQQNVFLTSTIDTFQIAGFTSEITPNVDLLSHAIQYGDKIGQTDLVAELVTIAETVRQGARNWRYYQFLGDHYAEQDNKISFDRIVQEFRQRLPADERSDSLELSWHQERQNDIEIDRIAADWLPPSQKRGSAVPLRLATIYLDRGDYDKVLQLTARALEGSSESQPTGSIGAIVFYRANAFDALFVRAAQEETIDCKKMEKYFANACRLYRSDLFDGVSRIMRTAADRRVQAMTLLFEETECPLPERLSAGPLLHGSDPAKSGNMSPDLKVAAKVVDQAIRAAVEGDIETYEILVQKLEDLEGAARAIIHASLVAAAEDEDHPINVQNAARDLAKRIHGVS